MLSKSKRCLQATVFSAFSYSSTYKFLVLAPLLSGTVLFLTLPVYRLIANRWLMILELTSGCFVYEFLHTFITIPSNGILHQKVYWIAFEVQRSYSPCMLFFESVLKSTTWTDFSFRCTYNKHLLQAHSSVIYKRWQMKINGCTAENLSKKLSLSINSKLWYIGKYSAFSEIDRGLTRSCLTCTPLPEHICAENVHLRVRFVCELILKG